MLDGLGGENAALVILQLAVELLGQLARRSNHDIEGLLGMAWAGQTEEEAHGRRGEVIDVVQIESTRLDGIGHGEQHLAIAGHAFVAMEDVHFAEAQATLENVLQQRRTTETVRITANDVDDEYFLDGRQFLLRLVFPFLVITNNRIEQRRYGLVAVELEVALKGFVLPALFAGLARAHRRHVALIQRRLMISINHARRA